MCVSVSQKPESSKDGVSQATTPGPDRRHNNRSFVDSVMVALSTEEDEEQGLLVVSLACSR